MGFKRPEVRIFSLGPAKSPVFSMDTGLFLFPFCVQIIDAVCNGCVIEIIYRKAVSQTDSAPSPPSRTRCRRRQCADPAGRRHDPDQAAINDPRPRSDMVRGRLRFDASRKDRSMPDKKIEFYEVFSAPTAFDTFLLRSVLDCASQRPEDAPETANTQNKKEITMDFKKLYFTLFNTLSDAVEQIDTHDYEEARLLLIHAQQEAEECYITSA